MNIVQPIYCLLQTSFIKAGTLSKLSLFTCLLLTTLASRTQEIKMYPGINLVLDGNIHFVVNNTAFKNDGSFTSGASTVKFTGNTDTTTAYVSGLSNTSFNNLTLDKTSYGIALKSPVGVKNVLTVSAGYLYADSNLTLLSDAVNTARLATVPSGANVFGKVMVERYIPAKRAWRLMTAPVTNASSIYNSWQNKGIYTPGKGILVTAPGGIPGLDNSNASSLKIWDFSRQLLLPVTNTFASISATNNGSADNTGYFVFIRGDRNPINFIAPNTNITTIKSIGRLQVGPQTFPASSINGGYTLIGNPYASPIDFNLVSRTNLLKRFYVWDPTLNSLGGYVTMDDVDNNDGIYSKSVSRSSQTKEIQSSQAFYVETNVSGAASITINETAKSTTNTTPVFRPAGTGTGTDIPGSLSTDLYLLNTDNSVVLADGTLVEFSVNYHDSVTNEDAIKFTNIGESIAMTRYGAILSIERRPVITAIDTIFFKLWRTTQRGYQLKFIPKNIYQPGMLAFFEDSYLSSSMPISLVNPTTISFSIDGNAASAVDNRFRIIFKPLVVLPVTFSTVDAYAVKDDIKVDWKVQDEINIIKYEVEKSANGLDFNQVSISLKNFSGSYYWIDASPIAGQNFYRIKSIDRSGEIKYSPVVSVVTTKNATHFTIVPNPVEGYMINVRFANQPKGDYIFNLFSNTGQLVFTNKVQIDRNSRLKVLKLSTALSPGAYQLQITGPANKTEIQKIIIED